MQGSRSRWGTGHVPTQCQGSIVLAVNSKDLQCTYGLCTAPIFGTFLCPCMRTYSKEYLSSDSSLCIPFKPIFLELLYCPEQLGFFQVHMTAVSVFLSVSNCLLSSLSGELLLPFFSKSHLYLWILEKKAAFFFNWPSLSRDAKKLGLILVQEWRTKSSNLGHTNVNLILIVGFLLRTDFKIDHFWSSDQFQLSFFH